jgi:putative membrane protein
LSVQWWCSATGQPWTWAWRAYPGVWLFLGLIFWWYLRFVDRYPPADAGAPGGKRQYRLWCAAGLVSIWLALDWPIGALGAGYLASFHTITYILLSFVAPPCLILALPQEWIRAAVHRPRLGRVLWWAGRPWIALAGFNAIVLASHVPEIVDTLMVTQAGALLIDLGWLVGGFLLWWPVMGPAPEVVRMSRPLKMGYLFLSTLAPIIPSAFLTFAEYPLYTTYEMAPRIFPLLTAQQDQQVAGLLMKLVGDLPVWFGFGVIFFRWAREEDRRPPPVHPDALKPAGSAR